MAEFVNRTKAAMDSRMQQSVVITFDDGSWATFTGPAIAYPGDKLRIVDTVFTEPRPLEDDCYWSDDTVKEQHADVHPA